MRARYTSSWAPSPKVSSIVAADCILRAISTSPGFNIAAMIVGTSTRLLRRRGWFLARAVLTRRQKSPRCGRRQNPGVEDREENSHHRDHQCQNGIAQPAVILA